MNRIIELDFFKGIAIILVVSAHFLSSNWINSVDIHPVYTWIYSFHMPLFVFISGFLIDHNSCNKEIIVGQQIMKKLKSLIVPFIVWTYLLSPIFTQSTVIFSLNEFVNPNARYWFVYMLFYLCLIYIGCEVLYRKNKFWGTIIFLLICMVLLSIQLVYPMKVINSVIQYIPIFFYGVVISKFDNDRKDLFCNVLLRNVFLVVFVMSSIYYLKFEEAYLNKLMKLLSSFSLSSIVVYCMRERVISSFNENKIIKVFSYIGQNSIVIYLTHFEFLLLFEPPAELLNRFTPFWVFIITIILSSPIISFCLLLGKIMEHFKWVNRFVYGR